MEPDSFGCSACYSYDTAQDQLRPAVTVEALHQEMARADVRRAAVSRIEQSKGSTLTANDVLAADIRRTGNLYGTWATVPTHTPGCPVLPRC